MGFLSKFFGKDKESSNNAPTQTFEEWEKDMIEKYTNFNSEGLSGSWGERWREIATKELGGYTLVFGKNPSDIIQKNPKAKDNLGTMLACCKAELQRGDIGEGIPAPFYFKRAAILLSKKKLYQKEIEICKLYIDCASNYLKKIGKEKDIPKYMDIAESKLRINKAIEKLKKQKKKELMA